METAVKIQDLCASYDHVPVLDHICMRIEPNKITALIGPSGCGKTTFLHCINRLLESQPHAAISGSIMLNHRDIFSMDEDELRRRVGLVFQTPTPFPFSIYKNMTYGPKYFGIRKKEQLDHIVQQKLTMAGLWDEVKDDLGKNALKLSGGQQQRLCIARALSVEPEILLLDEPCSALDVKATALIEQLLVELKKQYTIVLVTHNIAQAKRIADDVGFLHHGKLIEFNTSQQFFHRPQQPETQAFLDGVYG